MCISLAKCKCGPVLIMTKLEDTIGHSITMSTRCSTYGNSEVFYCAFCASFVSDPLCSNITLFKGHYLYLIRPPLLVL